MKKLIAISVVFALVAGAAFAQVTLGAELWTSVELIAGNSEDPDMGAGPGWDIFGDPKAFAKLSFSYEAEGGQAGIAGVIKNEYKSLKIDFDLDSDGTDESIFLPIDGYGVLEVDGAGWWKPMDMLTLYVGDKGFGRGDAIGWGSDYYALGAVKGKDFKKLVLFAEGSGNWFGLSLAPMDMFALNVSVINNGDPQIAGDAFGKYFMIQAVVNIPNDMGELAFTYDNNYWDIDSSLEEGGAIFVDYSGSPVAGLGINFAFSYFLGENTVVIGADEAPFFLALKAGYDVMEGLNAAVLFQTESFNFIMFGADINYSMDVSGFNLGLYAGIKVHMGLGDYSDTYNGGDPLIEWEFKPSLSKTIGGFTFLTHFKVAGSNTDGAGVNIELPIKFSYAF